MSMYLILSTWAIFICLTFLSFPIFAKEPIAKIRDFLISAKSMYQDTENELVELDGDIQLVYREQHISCNRAKINFRARKIELLGNVKVISPKSTLGGDQIFLDYESGTGLISNGFVQSGSVIFEGALLEKLSDELYFVSKADFTTCKNCPSTWSFSGSTIRAELGGYAYIKNSIMRVGGVPIFWLPYLIVPLKSDRQSGLLIPEFEQTEKGGLTFGQSYFWAINRNTDATFGFKNYELRGQKYLFEYRYALTDESYGKFNTAGLSDQFFSNEDRYNSHRSPNERGRIVDRWFIKHDQYLSLPNQYVLRSQLRNISDLQYPVDFEHELKNISNLERETKSQGEPSLENRVSLTKNSKDQHFLMDSSYYTNLLRGDPMSSNDNSVHRIPQLHFSQTALPLGQSSFYYNLDLDYTQFVRSGPAYDDLVLYSPVGTSKNLIRYEKNDCSGTVGTNPNWEDSKYGTCSRVRDGNFDPETDFIRSGQRLDFQPSIYRPFTIAKAFEIVPRLTYRETQYLFDVSSEPRNVRRYGRASVSSRTTFSNIFGDRNEARSELWKHEIQPELTYTYIPWIDHKSHYFFGTSRETESPFYSGKNIDDNDTGSSSGLQFDYNDRLYDRNLVTYSLTNKFIQKRWLNSGPQYRQVALMRISQSYDAFENSRDDINKEPFSDIATLFEVRLDHFQTNSIFNYFPYQKVTDVSSAFRLNDDTGRFIEFGLNKKYKIVRGQGTSETSRIEDVSAGAGVMLSYLNLLGRLTYDNNFNTVQVIENRIKSYSYITQLKPPGECWVLSFSFKQIAGGERSWKLNLLFNFDGQPMPMPTPDMLDEI